MLKINLLPEHFALVRRTKQLMVLFAVLAVGVLALWIGYRKGVLEPKIRFQEDRIAEFRPQASAVDQLETEATSIRGQVPRFARPVMAIRGMDKLPAQYKRAFEDLNEYFFANARMLTFTLSGDQIGINAEVNNTTDVGRFYLNILECPYITNIGFSAFGGGSGGGALAGGTIPIQVSATLRDGISLPSAGGSEGGEGAPAATPPGGGMAGATGPPAGSDGIGAMPSAAAPGGGVVMPEEM